MHCAMADVLVLGYSELLSTRFYRQHVEKYFLNARKRSIVHAT